MRERMLAFNRLLSIKKANMKTFFIFILGEKAVFDWGGVQKGAGLFRSVIPNLFGTADRYNARPVYRGLVWG